MKHPCPGKVGALKQSCVGEDMHVGPCFTFEDQIAGDLPERLESAMDLMFEPLLELANEELRKQREEEESPYWHGKPAVVIYDGPPTTMTLRPDDPMYPSMPQTWTEKEDRIAWVLTNFSTAMLAKLYQMLHEGQNYRHKSAHAIRELINAEKDKK